MNQMTWRRHLL